MNEWMNEWISIVIIIITTTITTTTTTSTSDQCEWAYHDKRGRDEGTSVTRVWDRRVLGRWWPSRRQRAPSSSWSRTSRAPGGWNRRSARRGSARTTGTTSRCASRRCSCRSRTAATFNNISHSTDLLPQLFGWLSSRTSVSGRRTFTGLHRTCSWWVTIYMDKPSAVGQPTRPTQPFILTGSINE